VPSWKGSSPSARAVDAIVLEPGCDEPRDLGLAWPLADKRRVDGVDADQSLDQFSNAVGSRLSAIHTLSTWHHMQCNRGCAYRPDRSWARAEAASGGGDLALAPRVERVVHRQAQLELAVVTELEVAEALGDREQAARLGCRVAVFGDVSAVDDPR